MSAERENTPQIPRAANADASSRGGCSDSRPPGFVHVDLDGLWTIAQAYGFPEADTFRDDPIFSKALPRLLDLLDALSISATFFIVGRDLELPQKRETVAAIAARGHELACHGYSHAIGMEALGETLMRDDIVHARDAIAALSGAAPIGFRAPGYAAGPRTLRAAADAGFRYDGSFLPVNDLAAWALRRAAKGLRTKVARELGGDTDAQGLARTGRDEHGNSASAWAAQYGGVRAYKDFLNENPELSRRIRIFPLAVSPGLKLPIHASLGMLLGAARVKSALRGIARCAGSAAPTSYLLHGMDCAAPEDCAGRLPRCLAGHAGFARPLEERLRFLEEVLQCFKDEFELMRTDEWLRENSA